MKDEIISIYAGAADKLRSIDVAHLLGESHVTDDIRQAHARLVAEEMIADCLSRPWLSNYVKANGKNPVVAIGTIDNNTSEHIDTEAFTKDFERELLNSGEVTFVADRFQREEIRGERYDQQEHASPESTMTSITDQVKGKQVRFYQTDLELINIENIEKVWIGSKEIKKYIAQDKYKP